MFLRPLHPTNYTEPCVVENPANSLFWETKCGAKGYTLSMATHSCIRHAPTVRWGLSGQGWQLISQKYRQSMVFVLEVTATLRGV